MVLHKPVAVFSDSSDNANVVGSSNGEGDDGVGARAGGTGGAASATDGAGV